MTDLTKINVPFGLLDAETQAALKAHGGPYEIFTHSGSWGLYTHTSFGAQFTYRVKPAPPKPREWWLRLTARGEVCGLDPAVGDPPPNWDTALTIRAREVL